MYEYIYKYIYMLMLFHLESYTEFAIIYMYIIMGSSDEKALAWCGLFAVK